MIPAQPVDSNLNPPLAIGSGIAAGLFTLAAIAGILWVAGSSDSPSEASAPQSRIGSIVPNADLERGDCFDFTAGSSTIRQFRIADCETSHLAQVSAKVSHPAAGAAYPGADSMQAWIADQCTTLSEEFIGTPILETTLDSGSILPDFDDWSGGDASASCYVRRLKSATFTTSAEGAGGNFPRGDEVVVSRLINGDCFSPTDGTNSYDLNSNSPVMVVPCDAEHNGVFFGRTTLDFPIGAIFPGEDEVGTATSQRCSGLFADHFNKSSDGFNYRYWRPNRQSWDLDDRVVLCAVLDTNPLVERFDPGVYQRFFDLPTGDCFNLGPEEDDESLRLDDQVRTVDCNELHVGQMIGSGELELDLAEPFPEGERIQQLAGGECEQLFVEFVGTSPYESDLGRFPFWYPNEPGWEDGDRRYACAFLEKTPRSESLMQADA